MKAPAQLQRLLLLIRQFATVRAGCQAKGDLLDSITIGIDDVMLG